MLLKLIRFWESWLGRLARVSSTEEPASPNAVNYLDLTNINFDNLHVDLKELN